MGPVFIRPENMVATEMGRIYIGCSDKHLYALDQRGLFLWSFATYDNIATRPVLAHNLVIFGSEDRHIYALDAETGELRWQYETGGAVVSSPALVRDLIVQIVVQKLILAKEP